jgi:glycosyltransferase involved in cell wall biosynthesis
MRVGIDVRALQTASGRRGVGAYIRGLLSGLALERRDEEILLFSAAGADGDEARPFERVVLSRPRRAITLWDQIAWPPLLSWRGVSVFHSPFYAVPRMRPRGCAIVQTVHDLTPLKMRGTVSPRQERVFRFNFRMARSADRILVPSEATRRDVIELLGIEPARVRVIPEAAAVPPSAIAEADTRADAARARAGIPPGRTFLLHTGGQDPVKNLRRLLDALARLLREGRDLDLVIAGEPGADTPALIAHAARAGVLDHVRLPGYLDRGDLLALYRGAAALVYPSLAEGFGLPVLEAMACGTPVVASREGAIPEVAGDAGLLVPADDDAAIAHAVGCVLDDTALRDRLRRAGPARAALFSWRETGRLTLEAYREVAA